MARYAIAIVQQDGTLRPVRAGHKDGTFSFPGAVSDVRFTLGLPLHTVIAAIQSLDETNRTIDMTSPSKPERLRITLQEATP